MCKYCSMEPNGDIPDDREDLFEIETGMLDSKVWLTGRICRSRLAIMLSGEHQQMLYREVEMNFCPVCGRQLI